MLIKKKPPKKEKCFLLRIKRKVFVLCLIGFCFNSYITFKQFIENETVTSLKSKKVKMTFTFDYLFGTCRFKRTVKDFSDFELEKYFNNTVALS